MTPVQLAAGVGQAELREAVEQRREREVAFHAGESGAEAEVDAVAEREVAGVGLIEVKILGVGETPAVAVGGCQRDDYLGAGGDGDPADRRGA